MSWWASFKDGTKAIGNGLMTGAKWTWENASLSRITVGLITYVANTFFQTLEQGLALSKAVPTLINNPDARKIVNGMTYLVCYDVFWLVLLNAGNNGIQIYCRKDQQQDEAWYSAYSLLLSSLTLANYTVIAYTWRQGAQLSARMFVLTSLGPAAFNANKQLTSESLCTELGCTTKRKMKGWGREPFILLGNDLLTAVMAQVPYVGLPVSIVLSIYFNGRYMTRLATPERCERHKEMMQESVLSLGLTYWASTYLMDMFIEATKATVGMPPYLYYRTMRQLLLLLHVNVASHMNLPRVSSKDATAYLDPLNVYELISRFVADMIFAGLQVTVPIYFKLEEGAKPIIPLSTALKFGIKVLNSDIPVINPGKPGFFKKAADAVRPWVLPSMFRSADGLINDKIIADHWPSIQDGAVSLIQILNNIGRTNKVSATLVAGATWIPGPTEVALQLHWGIPEIVTRYGLRLSKKEEFWEFAAALKGWFERHSVKFEVILDDTVQVHLHGDKPITELPKAVDPTPVKPALTLVSERSKLDTVAKPETLIPRKSQTLNPYNLLTNRKRDTKPDSSLPVASQSVNNSY